MSQPTYPNSWSKSEDGQWHHRPWFKVVINGLLRFFQPGPMKWMVFTRCDDTPDGSKNPPKVLNYRFRPIHHGP